ncbi:COG3014 family protein [Kistimonas scapharcae]|uniref:COG3014 family protein n=2 Tax=Kistimonas scapharcae TaxID=1036133 RepID=A0ABP8V6M3_9GAMM
MQSNQFDGFEEKLQQGAINEASSYAIEQADIDPETGHATDLLWALQAGNMMRYQKAYTQSNQYFDDAEIIIKKENGEGLAKDAAETTGSLLVNDAALDYEPTVYDGIMANTYKALNFMKEGAVQDARIEWNRVDERQRRSAEYFAEEISELRAEQEQELENGKKGDTTAKRVEQSLQKSDAILKEQGIDMAQWAPYKNYVNPFSTYMHGLFFMLNAQGSSDYNKAYDSMKRAYGLTNNAAVKTDMNMARSLAQGTSINRFKSTVWVVFENGLSVKKEEFRIDLPVFLLDNNVKYTGIALPKLVERNAAYPALQIGTFKTNSLADMDKIIKAEFKERFPYILAKELGRATLKTVMQKQINDQNPMAGLVASAYQLASTSADIRMWSSLPKEFQLARLPKTADSLVIKAEGMAVPVEVELGKNSRFDIVYVKAFSASQAPEVKVISI